MNELLSFLLGLLLVIILFISFVLTPNSRAKYCNSKYNRRKDSLDINLDMPEYKVCSIEETYAKGGGGWIAKYKLQNFYVSSKNNVSFQELVLYDKIGKYNIGDVLTLEKKYVGQSRL